MPGKIIRRAHISRAYVRSHREMIFVFGDNMAGKGFGGQAGAMRGEPNAIGVPTKWAPDRRPQSYFCDDDWDNGNVRHTLFEAFDRIKLALADGKDVVIPADGIGTGLAELPQRAPKIASFIDKSLAGIEATYRVSAAEP